MKLNSGKKPPLHRRINLIEMETIVHLRYKVAFEQIYDQVSLLQNDPLFIDSCRILYKKGYKDWNILMGIMSILVNLMANQLHLNPSIESNKKDIENLFYKLKGVTFPPTLFLFGIIKNSISTHSLAALQNYGFEFRRRKYNMEVVENFLRERLNHFDCDIPHKPLFGKPLGEWPIILP